MDFDLNDPKYRAAQKAYVRERDTKEAVEGCAGVILHIALNVAFISVVVFVIHHLLGE